MMHNQTGVNVDTPISINEVNKNMASVLVGRGDAVVTEDGKILIDTSKIKQKYVDPDVIDTEILEAAKGSPYTTSWGT